MNSYVQEINVKLTESQAVSLLAALAAACESWGVAADAEEQAPETSAAGDAQRLYQALRQVRLGNKNPNVTRNCSYTMVKRAA